MKGCWKERRQGQCPVTMGYNPIPKVVSVLRDERQTLGDGAEKLPIVEPIQGPNGTGFHGYRPSGYSPDEHRDRTYCQPGSCGQK